MTLATILAFVDGVHSVLVRLTTTPVVPVILKFSVTEQFSLSVTVTE